MVIRKISETIFQNDRKDNPGYCVEYTALKTLESQADRSSRIFQFGNFQDVVCLQRKDHHKLLKATIDSKTVLLKQFTTSHVNTPWNELKWLISLRHERVVRIAGAFFHCCPYIVLESCTGEMD